MDGSTDGSVSAILKEFGSRLTFVMYKSVIVVLGLFGFPVERSYDIVKTGRKEELQISDVEKFFPFGMH